MSGKSGCEYIKCEYVRRDTGGVRCTHPGGICIYRDEADTIARLEAEIAALRAEVGRLRQERDDQFWAREHERKELIAARTALEDGYRQGWEHRKQVQDSFNEATIAVSRKFQEDLLKILTIVENDNDPDWSKVQKIAKGKRRGCFASA